MMTRACWTFALSAAALTTGCQSDPRTRDEDAYAMSCERDIGGRDAWNQCAVSCYSDNPAPQCPQPDVDAEALCTISTRFLRSYCLLHCAADDECPDGMVCTTEANLGLADVRDTTFEYDVCTWPDD